MSKCKSNEVRLCPELTAEGFEALCYFRGCFHWPSPRLLTLLVPVNLAGPDSFLKTVGAVSKRIGQNGDFKLVRKTAWGPALSPSWLALPRLFPELGKSSCVRNGEAGDGQWMAPQEMEMPIM